MSSISAGLSDGTALVSTGDTTGELVLKTNGSTTAVTIGTDQSVSCVSQVAANDFYSTSGFYVNDQTITANYTVASGKNAMSVGDIEVDTGVTVTVSVGSTWVIV